MLLAPVVILLVSGQCVSTPFRPWNGEEARVMNASRERERAGAVVSVGTQRVITVPEGIRWAKVEPREIAEVRLLDHHHLLVIGDQMGRAVATVSTADQKEKTFAVVVEDGQIDSCNWQRWLRWLTPDTTRPPRMQTRGDRLAWVGEVDSVADLQRLRDLARAAPHLIFDVHPSEALIAARLHLLDRTLEAHGIHGLRSAWRDGEIALVPNVELSNEAFTHASRAAEPFVQAARTELR